MDQGFLEEQRKASLREIDSLADGDQRRKQDISVVSQYISSLLEPERFTEAQREDLRKLALELGYKEDTAFTDWLMSSGNPQRKTEVAG